MKREFGIFGATGDARRATAGYVLVGEDEGAIDAVRRRVERDTGARVVTCRHDGTAMSGDRPRAKHYELTLGRPCMVGGGRGQGRRRQDGWNIVGRLWVSIPVAGA